LDLEMVQEGDFMPSGGRVGSRSFFELSDPQRPTAIFTRSDLMAYGVMSAAEEFGLRVPEDIAVIGFDDNPSSAHMRPALTTVRQPFSDMGRRAIELLFSQIEQAQEARRGRQPLGVKTGEAPRIELPTSLVIRESCGAPQARASRSGS